MSSSSSTSAASAAAFKRATFSASVDSSESSNSSSSGSSFTISSSFSSEGDKLGKITFAFGFSGAFGFFNIEPTVGFLGLEMTFCKGCTIPTDGFVALTALAGTVIAGMLPTDGFVALTALAGTVIAGMLPTDGLDGFGTLTIFG